MFSLYRMCFLYIKVCSPYIERVRSKYNIAIKPKRENVVKRATHNSEIKVRRVVK
jgi:hypothetical protein